MPRATRTDAEFEAWISSTWLPDATASEKAEVAARYPRNQTEGSPFGTGVLNQYRLNTEFKRTAAFQGDMVFQAPRRLFVKELANSTTHQSKIWTYRASPLPWVPAGEFVSDSLPCSEQAPQNGALCGIRALFFSTLYSQADADLVHRSMAATSAPQLKTTIYSHRTWSNSRTRSIRTRSTPTCGRGRHTPLKSLKCWLFLSASLPPPPKSPMTPIAFFPLSYLTSLD